MMRHVTDGCGQQCAVVPDFCPACGRPGGEWEEVTEAVTPSTEAAASWVCPRCERRNGEDATACVECGAARHAAPAVARCLLHGDAGEHELRAGGQLVVGRAAASPTATALAPFDNVSWVQAVVTFFADGTVTAIDLASTNGTWAVGAAGRRRLTPLAPTPLGEGESLQLGDDPSGRNAVVRIRVEGGER